MGAYELSIPGLAVTPASRSVIAGAGTTTFVVTNIGGGTMVYTASEAVSWLSITGGGIGTNGGTITISYVANPNTTARTGTVMMAATGASGSPQSVRVIQAGVPLLTINPASTNIPADASSGRTIGVTANVSWTGVANPSWITVISGNSGSGNGPVTYSVDANGGPSSRQGTITVSGGGITQTFTIRQNAVTAQVNDFDGDWISDQAVFQPAGANWSFLYSGSGSATIPFGWSAVLPVPADYDGDGATDIAVYHPATGNWYIWNSVTRLTKIIQFGMSATVPLPGDYDGDGKADLAVFHQATARWYFLCSTAGRYSVPWGWSAVIPVPADYDGDGKTDIAVYHPATGNWYIYQSSTGRMLLQGWGWSQAIPVPADYDGDGKTDIAVFHRAPANWYIKYSGGGSLTKQFGWWETIPVPADYDGDGQADLAVYHPAGGKWYYIHQPTDRVAVVRTLGGPGKKPVLLYPLIHSWFRLP